MDTEECVLDAVLNFLIPPDSSRQLPSGLAVFDKVAFLAKPPTWFKDGVSKVNEEVQKVFSTDFSSLPAEQRHSFFNDYQRKFSVLLNNTMALLVEQYYCNKSVLAGIGYGDRAPFPDGNEIIDGDFSLLESVYDRGSIYKKV